MEIRPVNLVIPLLAAVTGPLVGEAFNAAAFGKVIEATVTGSGAVNAVIEIYGNTRNNNTDGILIATITLSGTAPQRDGFAFDAPWPFVYARLVSVSGTSAAVTVDLAV